MIELKRVTYVNRKEKWWFHATRGMNLFAYRFWWLVLLVFVALVTLFYFFCWQQKDELCEHAKYALAATNDAINTSSNCCSCAPPEDVIPCNTATSESGGQGYHENMHWLGNNPGLVTINYDMYAQKDKMEVFYDNELVASTSVVVSDKGQLQFFFPALNGQPKFCRILLTAPETGTSWEYFLSCPEN